MAITTAQIYKLNRMNSIAQAVQLGTLIAAAEALPAGASSVAMTSAYFLVGSGAGTGTAVAMSGDCTLANTGAVTIGAKKVTAAKTAMADGTIFIGDAAGAAAEKTLSGDVTMTREGVMSIGASKVKGTMLNKGAKETYEVFGQPLLYGGVATYAPTGTTGDVNVFSTLDTRFQYHVKGTQTILIPVWSQANGVAISLDLTNDDGIEVTQGITSASRVAMTAGTDRFYFQAKIKLADVSGTDDCAIAWRKAEGYQANLDDYDEMAALNLILGDVKIETILNNGATATTDTTAKVTDGQYAVLRIEYDHTVGLTRAIALANDVKAKYNAHCADATHHTTAADTVNTTAAANATSTLAQLITLVTELLTDFAAHETDAALASAWAFHAAQETGTHALVSATAPTDLPTAIAKLNDLKTKFDAHDADADAHAAQGGHPTTVALAGSTTFKVGVNGAAVAAPAVVAPFTFDDGEVVVPCLFHLMATTSPGAAYLQHWEVGLLS